jgi:hypothetical protein
MDPKANKLFSYLNKTYPYLINKDNYAEINEYKKLPLFNYKKPNLPKKPLEIFENSEVANNKAAPQKKYKGRAIIYM